MESPVSTSSWEGEVREKPLRGSDLAMRSLWRYATYTAAPAAEE